MGIRPPVNPGIRLLQHVVASFVIGLIAVATATKILDGDPESVPLRAGMVALALAGFLYWVWVVVRVIQAQDEFSRRLHLVALAVAFGLTGVFVFTAWLLQHAHFIDYVPVWTIFGTMVLTWWLSIVVTTRYYAR
jgi:hypothetical protein